MPLDAPISTHGCCPRAARKDASLKSGHRVDQFAPNGCELLGRFRFVFHVLPRRDQAVGQFLSDAPRRKLIRLVSRLVTRPHCFHCVRCHEVLRAGKGQPVDPKNWGLDANAVPQRSPALCKPCAVHIKFELTRRLAWRFGTSATHSAHMGWHAICIGGRAEGKERTNVNDAQCS